MAQQILLDKSMKKHFTFPFVPDFQKGAGVTLGSLIFIGILFFSACSTIRLQIKQFAQEKSVLPRDMKFADEDYDLLKETACIVKVNDDGGTFLMGKQQFAKEQISERIAERLRDKTPDKRIVYIEAAESVKYETLVTLLNLIRKADNDKVGLVVVRKNNKELGNIPARFEVKLPAEPNESDMKTPLRPNPLTLVVEIDKTGNLFLNKEKMGNVGETTNLMNKLSQVFKERENNGVLREGTNEVEKTTFIKASRSIKYGDFAKVVDAVKGAGAQPIGLQIDDLND